MNISQLIKETQYVEIHDRESRYGPKNTFGNKKFGQIYLYNKKVMTKPGFSIIEVSMMIKAVTDTVEKGEHKVMLAISGVKQQSVQAKTLANIIRSTNQAFEDTETYPDEVLVKAAIESKPLAGKTVIENENGNYTIIEDNIPKDSEILVWCSCSNYYWVWQYYNVENGVDIFGKLPDRYTHRTQKGAEAMAKNRPIRNPGRHPGMCKHIMLLLALLMDTDSDPKGVGNPGSTNVLKESRSVVRNFKANIDRFQKAQRLTPKEFDGLMKKWEKEREKVAQSRGISNDIFLASKSAQRTSKTRNWEKIQNTMVGKRGKRK